MGDGGFTVAYNVNKIIINVHFVCNIYGDIYILNGESVLIMLICNTHRSVGMPTALPVCQEANSSDPIYENVLLCFVCYVFVCAYVYAWCYYKGRKKLFTEIYL